MSEMRKLIFKSFQPIKFAYQMLFDESYRALQEFMLLAHTPAPETSFQQCLDREKFSYLDVVSLKKPEGVNLFKNCLRRHWFTKKIEQMVDARVKNRVYFRSNALPECLNMEEEKLI
jgi:hypothetical protein